MPAIRIATFNVNGVNGRLPVLLKWLNESAYDIVCLQELKTSDEKFPVDAIREAGYGAIWHGQKSYNGVAILARGAVPAERRRGLPGDPGDTHSRYLEAEVNGLIVGCLYLPNGNPAPGPKFDYKLRWFDRLMGYGRSLLKEYTPVVLCGDYNVVPTPIDAVAPRRWLGDAVYFPESRQTYARMLGDGWIDAVRRIHPEKGIYTYWNFAFRGGYDRSSGLRMDHLLISPSLSDRLRAAGVDADLRAWENPATMCRPGSNSSRQGTQRGDPDYPRMVSSLDKLPLHAPDGYNAVVETPRESRTKFAYDAETGLFRAKKLLAMGFAFPFAFGFFPSTRAQDGDPLDVLLLTDADLPMGSLVRCRLIGGIAIEERTEGEIRRNDRLLAVPLLRHQDRPPCELSGVPSAELKDIEDFLVAYQAADGKETKVKARLAKAEAESIVRRCNLFRSRLDA